MSLPYLRHYREHAEALTARQAIAESRKSRGFLSGLFRRSQDLYKPTYNYVPDGSACRIYGSLTVKRVTGIYPCCVRLYLIHHSCGASLLANLHITTVGHGYSSNFHVDHNRMYHNISRVLNVMSYFTVMNLSHVITEFSFGKHFPEITQPLDNSFEITQDRMSFFSGCDPRNICRFHCISILSSSRPDDLHCTTLRAFTYEPVQRDTL